MIIPIYIYGNENREMGIPAKYKLIDFTVDERKIIGYWIDPDVDQSTGTQDIIFYAGGSCFRTPLEYEMAALIHKAVNDNINQPV